MYFVPEKGRLYRWAVHTKASYRYLLTLSIFCFMSGMWFFVINPWFVGLLQYEQASVQRAGQHRVDACVAERLIAQKTKEQEALHKQMERLLCGHSENSQLAFVFEAAQKNGVLINSFAHEKEKQKGWRTKKYKSLSVNGTLDQCLNFLAVLQSSPHMIQCKQLTLQKEEQGRCALQCQLEFIACG